ncbi:MAG: transcription termination factor NusA, partial [Candidatus Faecousia sp.]|nr:transcription termination factor NusA [Candidatus Faecousia sp.]
VVEELEDEDTQMTLEEAREIDDRYEVGDIIEFQVDPSGFGRIAAQTAKQVVVQKIREAERKMIYDDFVSRKGEIVTGRVGRIFNDTIYVSLGNTEGVLSRNEQVAGEKYRVNDRIKVYVMDVKDTAKGPQVFLSRSHPGLVKRLFELEVPEIEDGTVVIKGIAREAGSRTKLAVHAVDPNLDPVGTCVGPKGSRVAAVVNELHGEKMDIVVWNEDPAKFVAAALAPADVISVTPLSDEKSFRVLVPDDQLSLAIGKEGQNARLAARLTGHKIDIKPASAAEAPEA